MYTNGLGLKFHGVVSVDFRIRVGVGNPCFAFYVNEALKLASLLSFSETIIIVLPLGNVETA